MPIYEYQCEECEHQTEVLQRLDEGPLQECPHCGGGPMRKLMSAPAFQFKGSGWYVTDYARKSGGESSGGKESGGESQGSSGKESSTKGESSGKSESSGKGGSSGKGESSGKGGSSGKGDKAGKD